jgi:hypothetical protein
LEIIQAKPKPVYVKPPGSKPRRLGTYFYKKSTLEDDGTILVWVTGEGHFKAVHPISGQWLSEETLHRVLREAAMDMPGSSDAVQKLTYDILGGAGLEIVTVRYDFQYKAWFADGTPPGVPRKYVQRTLYEIPDGETLINLAEAFAQRMVLEQAGSVHWRAITALRPFNERNSDIAGRIVKTLGHAIVPIRAEPQIPEESAPDPEAATDTAAP